MDERKDRVASEQLRRLEGEVPGVQAFCERKAMSTAINWYSPHLTAEQIAQRQKLAQWLQKRRKA